MTEREAISRLIRLLQMVPEAHDIDTVQIGGGPSDGTFDKIVFRKPDGYLGQAKAAN